MNHPRLPVHRRPKLAFFASGDELVMPGSTPAAGEIVHSNGYAVLAMARREVANDEVAVIKAISEAGQGSDIDPVRLALRALITAFSQRRVARRVSFEALFSQGLANELAKSVQKVAQLVGERSDRLLPARTRPVTPTSLFIVTRAISGIMRAALQEESPFLGTPEFEDELVHLVQAYFGGE